MKFFLLFICHLLLFASQHAQAQTADQPILDRWFWPNKGLPRNAASPLFQDSLSLRPYQIHQTSYYPNQQINEPVSAQYQLADSTGTESLDSFSMEFWLLDHVNHPVGFEIFIGETSVFALWNGSYYFSKATKKQLPWDQYWAHVVLTYSDGLLEIRENGVLISSQKKLLTERTIVLHSYLKHEPYMELDDWIKHLVIHKNALNETQIQRNFVAHQAIKKTGKRFPDRFHFMAEPYLFAPAPSSIQLTFETDRSAKAEIWYGTELPLQHSISIPAGKESIITATLPDLIPAQAYFYQVLAEDSIGNTQDSGVLTFRTSHETEDPVFFGIVSDTEARPWINEQIGLKLWDERPDFVIHMGDVTDGGKENDQWQWTQEYFPGSAALTSRIPMAPVAGNGEGDLFWYNQYHPQASPGGYYKFSYGIGEFFMMNSNDMDGLQPGGQQYEWLKSALETSNCKWKFVSMHHAPYSADEDDYGNTWTGNSTHGDRTLQPLIKLMEDNGVQVMFFGHLHTYMRTFPMKEDKINLKEGIHFIQVGGMGGNLEDFAPTRIPFVAKTYRGFHYLTVALTTTSFELRMYNTEGAMLDQLLLSN
ncbi:metallophosphoesterase [Algoriphagus sp. D3-2-R+10]|uniref:metallophosphoesterase family protein n=1 Tax=Algoriphagus aurantiacus TaxID=3103948 RepID=UPI002B3AB88B|nr:metallophosphoesterase [Algoriphagus sp. D3-2-R+10]MEB2774353.1 metallophosphoesterase [Algoriphagus sp. D3-2-R+10]